MNDDARRDIALMRFGIISPLANAIYEGGIKAFFREASNRTYINPSGEEVRFSATSIERWYYTYKNFGFEGIIPQKRIDSGRSRKVDDDIMEQIKYLKTQYPRLPATLIHQRLLDNGTIKYGEMSLSTINRCVNTFKSDANQKAKKGRIILAKLNDELIGYMVYSQQGLSDTNNQAQKMIIHVMVSYPRATLLAFLSFFNGQKDQITYIEVFTFDKSFYHLINNINYASDPKTLEIISLKAADHALGLMYYAINPEGLLERIKNRTTQHICFNIIYPKTRITKPYSINETNSDKVEITLKLNEFSSWIIGATSLNELYNHGRLETNRPEALKQLDYEFNFEAPISYTRF